MSDLTLIDTILVGSILTCLSAAMALTGARVWRGPRAIDRVIALDIFSVAFVIGSALWQILYPQSRALNVGLIVGLLLFFSTLGFALAIEKGENEADGGRR